MVSLTQYGNGASVYVGLSTDTKPEAAGNGDCFMELDTSKIYLFDASGASWIEWGA